jgi:4-hydroxy-3-polyprenylbenzoate decarboxylase
VKRIIVGISGASGAIYGVRLLEVIRDRVESHLIITAWARKTIEVETSYPLAKVLSLASYSYDNEDLSGRLASGSFKTDGMVIIPCSIRTLSAVATCQSGTLLHRAADVALKERRRLILCVRETPFHLEHLRLMQRAAECGAIILPPIPAFYFHPNTIGDIIDHTIGKILDLFDVEHDLVRRWNGGLHE